MGMSTHVEGFVPPDEQWQQMKAVWDACAAAGIDQPSEVDEFFDGQEPDPNGQEVEIPHQDWQNGHSQGVEIKTEDIPKNVKVIRFYNSW
jgi:hypothetical protein